MRRGGELEEEPHAVAQAMPAARHAHLLAHRLELLEAVPEKQLFRLALVLVLDVRAEAAWLDEVLWQPPEYQLLPDERRTQRRRQVQLTYECNSNMCSIRHIF